MSDGNEMGEDDILGTASPVAVAHLWDTKAGAGATGSVEEEWHGGISRELCLPLRYKHHDGGTLTLRFTFTRKTGHTAGGSRLVTPATRRRQVSERASCR